MERSGACRRTDRVLVWKRPEGVIIMIPGGLNGYPSGNSNLPW